jgi:hypothetical protein
MHEEFLPNDSSELPFAEVSIPASTNPGYGNEYVKVMVIGSRKGIDLIIKRLCCLGFAQVSEWSPPVPYENSGEMMRLVRKKVSLR